jgi:hypothetical protein
MKFTRILLESYAMFSTFHGDSKRRQRRVPQYNIDKETLAKYEGGLHQKPSNSLKRGREQA